MILWKKSNFNPEDIKILGYKLVLEQISTPLNFDSELISYHGFHVKYGIEY